MADASPALTNVDCEFVGRFRISRCSADAIDWTHYIDVDASVNILDNITRLYGSNALNYAGDGSKVRIPSGVNNTYVVVFVEPNSNGTKRVYLMRHFISDWTQV